ncbi:MAG: glycosyltransferase family 2 protein [Anaerolineales bacterium]|nr:glycosyltransferase family 2 protein [Anaerolineales bacterium]
MTLAPVCIPTYTRINHLRRTIEALKENRLADETEVHIFSDGARAGDEEKVAAVRSYLKTISGFKKIEIVENQTNQYPNGVMQAIRGLLSQHEKIIFMEEDIVTAPVFLEYMNFALEEYESNPRIFSIAGYCPPIPIPKDYPNDVFFFPRFNPWGFGMWKDRFDKLEMKIPKRVINEIFLNPRRLYDFSRGGLDMLPLTLNNYFGYANGLDSKTFSQQFMMNMLTVYPVKHLVDNIGLDGSGVHTKKKPQYRVRLSNEPFKKYSLPQTMEMNPEIMSAFYKFRSGNYLNKIKILLWSVWILAKRAFSKSIDN